MKLLAYLSLFLSLAISSSDSLEDEAVSWLQNYLKVDTVNPPGN